jgi:hypothetical protein
MSEESPERSCSTCRYRPGGPEELGCSAECWEPELVDWDPDPPQHDSWLAQEQRRQP